MEKFGVVLRSQVTGGKKKRQFHRAAVEYRLMAGGRVEPVSLPKCPWQGHYKRFTGFSDLKQPFDNFAYGFHPERAPRVYEPLDFIPRLRSSRFGTLFHENSPLTPVEPWLYKQFRAARYNSLKGAQLYNTALTAFDGLLGDHRFSECLAAETVFTIQSSGKMRRLKEGDLRQVAEIGDLLPPGFEKIGPPGQQPF